MIGIAYVVIRRGKDKNDFHAVNVWEMCLSMPKTTKEKAEFRDQILVSAEKWKPEFVTSDQELEAISHATNCISPTYGGDSCYHEKAADIVYLIDLVTGVDGRTNDYKRARWPEVGWEK
jgi:hypothetical protein